MSRNWRDLSGRSNWKGLLDPLSIDLRRYILHYGQLAQATYDAFNHSANTQFPTKDDDFFSKVVGLASTDDNPNPLLFKHYAVTKKLSHSRESHWIGYVAVATEEGKEALGRRDIVVAWRGTIQPSEWLQDLHFHLAPAPLLFPHHPHSARIHHGFYSIYTSYNTASQFTNTSVRDQVLGEIRRLVEEYKKEEISISITGHSLGAALATINALDIVANGFNACPVTVFAFACPRVGNSEFKKVFCGYKDLRELRIRNRPDIVPNLPLGYSVVGEELVIDSEKSKHFWLWKIGGIIINSHHLVAYLHGIAIARTLERNNGDLDKGVRHNQDNVNISSVRARL